MGVSRTPEDRRRFPGCALTSDSGCVYCVLVKRKVHNSLKKPIMKHFSSSLPFWEMFKENGQTTNSASTQLIWFILNHLHLLDIKIAWIKIMISSTWKTLLTIKNLISWASLGWAKLLWLLGLLLFGLRLGLSTGPAQDGPGNVA